MYKKVSRDPLYSEIFMYPLEILAADTKAIQRLRYLSQLVGSQMSYPAATHTRFSHSLGVMHVAGLYSAHLFGTDSPQFRLSRLAGLVHDIGHGPFSHQFDDIVYSAFGYEEGHDEFRKRLLLEKLPELMKSKFDNADEQFKKSVMEDLEQTLGKISENPFNLLMENVNEIFEGERSGDPLFNVIQGPLGADRMDFVLRDAYFSGVRYYGTVPMDRIIRNSAIMERDGKEFLSYNIKTVDDMYTVLFGRFMMYKNVYFHKTSRAADMMVQELLTHSIKPLKLGDYLENLDKFLDLTDEFITQKIEFIHEFKLYDGENAEDVSKAYDIIQRLKSRDLWKLVVEIPYTTTGIDPGTVSKSLGEETLKKMRKNIETLISTSKIGDDDERSAKEILANFEDIFMVDTPYKLTLFYPDEFLSTKVYIHDDDGKVMTFEEFEKKYPTYKLMSGNMLQLVRIYAKKDVRIFLNKYYLIPNGISEATTRW